MFVFVIFTLASPGLQLISLGAAQRTAREKIKKRVLSEHSGTGTKPHVILCGILLCF